MIVFVVLLLVPIIIQHFVFEHKNVNFEKKNEISLRFFFVVFALLVMFRHVSVGNDTRNYIYIFNKYCDMDWSEVIKATVEFGFAYYNKIISLFSKEPRFFLAISAVLTIAMIYPTYKRLATDTSLTIVLFCVMSTFVMTFSGVRQMLAVGLGFVAYEFVRKKRKFMFLLVLLLAMSFHISAFMLIFMYPLYHIKLTKKWLIGVIPIFGIVFIFNKQIFVVLTTVLAQFTKYEGGVTSTGAYMMIVLFSIFAIFSFLIPEESLLDQETLALRNFLLFSLSIQMFAPLHTLAMRMNYYYIIFIPLLLPKIIACKSEKWSQFAVLGRHVMVVFFLVYFFMNANGSGNLNVFPYHFFWENV